MNITEELTGLINPTIEEQQIFINKMKENKFFDLNETDKNDVINFLCEKVDQNVVIDYLYHVLDNEILWPIDDESVKTLFSDERMQHFKTLMLSQLDEDSDLPSDEKLSDED